MPCAPCRSGRSRLAAPAGRIREAIVQATEAAGEAGSRAAPPARLGAVIDWKLAGTVARGVANLQPAGDPGPFEQLAGPAEEAERLVSAYTALVPVNPVPVAEAVDRSGWIEANLAALAAVLEPAAERIAGKAGMLGNLAGGVLAIEAGAVSGFLAGRVLGQYEFPVLEPDKPARLLFVAPNLAHAAK